MGACRLGSGSKDVLGAVNMPNAQILVPKFYCAIKKTNRVYGEVVGSLAAAKNRPDERGGFLVQKNKDALQGRQGGRVQEPPRRNARGPHCS